MTEPTTPTLLPGAWLDPGVEVGSGVTLGANAVVLAAEAGATPTRLGDGAVIGANATVTGGVTIGIRARVLPGSVVTRSVPAQAIVEGNPARIVGYQDTGGGPSPSVGAAATADTPGVRASRVAGVSFHTMRLVHDMRGNLTAGEFERDVPFVPLRWFLVFDVPGAESRGAHAHHECHQFLVAVKGSIGVAADDGHAREEFVLDRPNVGLYLPPRTWAIQYGHTQDATLLVFASHHYDAADYIREYAEFQSVVGAA